MPGRSEQDAAFLEALRRTGNARLAARDCALNRATLYKRRARDPAFAEAWEDALAAAHQEILPTRSGGRGTARSAVEGPRAQRADALRTEGGEPHLVRTRSGRLQLRRAPPGRITPAAERAFLAALGRGASVRLAAATVGFAHTSFYARARADRAFQLEMRAALALGADRLELAAIEAATREPGGDWLADAADAPLFVVDAASAIQLLHYHRKRAATGRAGGRAPAPMDPAEAKASILRQVAAIKRADARKKSSPSSARGGGPSAQPMVEGSARSTTEPVEVASSEPPSEGPRPRIRIL